MDSNLRLDESPSALFCLLFPDEVWKVTVVWGLGFTLQVGGEIKRRRETVVNYRVTTVKNVYDGRGPSERRSVSLIVRRTIQTSRRGHRGTVANQGTCNQGTRKEGYR